MGEPEGTSLRSGIFLDWYSGLFCMSSYISWVISAEWEIAVRMLAEGIWSVD